MMGIARALTDHDRSGQRMPPSSPEQSAGPFLFFEHFVPLDVAPGHHHDVRPHPHIGQATGISLSKGTIAVSR